jgi:hypothetical protein
VRPGRPTSALLAVLLTAAFAWISAPRLAAADGGPERVHGTEISSRGRNSLRTRPIIVTRDRGDDVGASAPDAALPAVALPARPPAPPIADRFAPPPAPVDDPAPPGPRARGPPRR